LADRVLGVFWPDETRAYVDGTVFCDRLVVRPGISGHDHPDNVRRRLDLLAWAHPSSTIIVRVDWHERRSFPDPSELDEWAARVAWAINHEEWRALGDRLVFQMCNEPSLEGVPTWSYTADLFNGGSNRFYDLVLHYTPEASAIPAPEALFDDRPLGATSFGDGLSEESPWIVRLRRSLCQLVANGPLDGLAIHLYGDPAAHPSDPALEPLTDTIKTPEGWRFGLNAWRSIKDVLASEGLVSLPLFVTEINTAARYNGGEVTPAGNYPPGWLRYAVPTAMSLGNVHSTCWFVGIDRSGGEWSPFAMHTHPALAPLRADFDWMQAHGW